MSRLKLLQFSFLSKKILIFSILRETGVVVEFERSPNEVSILAQATSPSTIIEFRFNYTSLQQYKIEHHIT